MALFSFGIFVFFCIFFGATIFFFVGPQAIFGTDCTSGSKTELVRSLYATSDEAYSKFCKQDCPCLLEDKNSELYQILSDPDLNMQLDGKNRKFVDCINATNVTSSIENIDVMAAL